MFIWLIFHYYYYSYCDFITFFHAVENARSMRSHMQSICGRTCNDFQLTLIYFNLNNHFSQVIPADVKQKEVRLSYPIVNPMRQSVEYVASLDDIPLYEMTYKKLKKKEVSEAWEFRRLAEEYKKRNFMQKKDTEDSAWENLAKRSKTGGKNIQDQPVYAMDSEESLFESCSWNMNEFSVDHSIINCLVPDDELKMPGIHTTFVNIGMLHTWFCLHCEDSDIASVNFLHSGAPKHWYCVPAREGPKLEKMLMKLIDEKYECSTVYRHKSFLLPPEMLAKENIEFTKVIQNPGELIFTLYGAYHWGFNAGFNVCESSRLAWPIHKEFESKLKIETQTDNGTAKNPIKMPTSEKTCMKCDLTFARPSVKKIHDETYHGAYLTIYKCDNCSLESLNLNNITNHYKKMHPEIPVPDKIGSKTVENTEQCKFNHPKLSMIIPIINASVFFFIFLTFVLRFSFLLLF